MKKLAGVLCVFFLLLVSIATGSFALAAREDTALLVPESKAKDVAVNFIKQSRYASNWANSQVLYSHRVYNLNDEVTAYVFTIRVGDEDAGHILVSAIESLPPVLEYGDSVFPNPGEGEKLYYFGALSHLSARDAKHVITKYDELKQDRLKVMEDQGKKDSAEFLKLANSKLTDLKTDSKKHQKEWNRLMSSGIGNTPSIVVTTFKELPVIRLYQRMSGVTKPNSACGPTTGAMIVNYLKSQGYSVRASAYYGGDAALINHMYYDMGTSDLGTSINGFVSGMEKHLNHDYSPALFYPISYAAFGNWDKFETSINSNRPVGLRFDRFRSSEYTFAEYHFVAGVGYDYSGGEDAYVGLKDPDKDPNATSTLWINWGVNCSDMSMGVLYQY